MAFFNTSRRALVPDSAFQGTSGEPSSGFRAAPELGRWPCKRLALTPTTQFVSRNPCIVVVTIQTKDRGWSRGAGARFPDREKRRGRGRHSPEPLGCVKQRWLEGCHR